MKLMAGYSMCKILVLGLVVSSLAAEGRDFKWTRGGGWGNYADSASWTVDDAGVNQEAAIPEENDWIRTDSSTKFYIDLGGAMYFNQGFIFRDPNGNVNAVRDLWLTNGTLVVLGSCSNYFLRPTIYNGGKLVHAESAVSRFGYSAAKMRFTVKPGGELQMRGTVTIDNSDFYIEEGGKAEFDFKSFGWNSGAFNQDGNDPTGNTTQDNQGIFNSGEVSFPNGFVMNPLPAASALPPDFRIRQDAGTMTLGGDICWNKPADHRYGKCYFYINGGKLAVKNNTKIYGFDEIKVADGVALEVEIDEGKTLDLTEVVFGENTTLSVVGSESTVILGSSSPKTLTMSGDGVDVVFGGSSPEVIAMTGDGVNLSFDEVVPESLAVTGDNSTIEFEKLVPKTLAVAGNEALLVLADSAPETMNLESSKMTIRLTDHIEFKEVTGYENTDFEIEVEGRRGVQVSSEDRNLLSHIYGNIGELPDMRRLQNDYSLAYYREQSDIYCLAESVQRDFDSPTTWKIKAAEGYETPIDYPGYNDFLHPLIGSYSSHLSFNLNGRKYKVRGMNYDYAYAWPRLEFDLKKGDGGSLEFVESFTNRNIQALRVFEGARLIIGHNCKAGFAWQNAVNMYIIYDKGTFDCFGDLMVGTWRITNDVNGVVNFAPKSFTLNGWGWHEKPCWFDNQGQWDFPNGLTINSICTASNQLGPWSFNQRNGTMRFGGPLINNNAKHRFDFNLYGGTLKVDSDLEMGFCTNVGMPDENTAASIDVADGKTLNWTNAAFAAGTKLFKKGEGMLRLGANVPELVVSNGTLRIESAAEIASLTLSDCATFEIAASGIEIASAQLGENAVFTVDVDKVKRRVFAATLVRSEDAALLAAVKDKVSVPEDCSVEIDGNALKLVSNAGLKVIVR